MLEHSTNYEQMLDEVLVKSLPYLIFSPPEFSAKLSKSMASLWQSYENRHSGNVAFLQNVEAVSKMLDNPETAWEPVISQRICSFERERMSWWMRIRAVEQDFMTLKLRVEELSKNGVKTTPTKKGPKPIAPAIAKQVLSQQKPPSPSPQPAQPAQDAEYSVEIAKLKAMLENGPRQFRPGTLYNCTANARMILKKYNGVIPSDEQCKNDYTEMGLSKSRVSDIQNSLSKLRKAMSSS